MSKSTTLVCAGLMIVIGLLVLPPLFSAIAANAPIVGPFAPADLTIGRSHVLFQALEQYVQDNDERMPPMTGATMFDAALAPYVKNPATFLSADTGKLFQPNAAVSGMPLARVGPMDTTAVFGDEAPGEPTIITFLDGHVEQNGIQTGDPVLVSISRARTLALGIEQYTQDYDDTLPPEQTAAQLETAIYPYTRSHLAFTDNLTGQPFIPNAALSGLALRAISGDPSTIPLVTSAKTASDGYKTIAYLDGHAVHGAVGAPVANDSNNLRGILLGVILYAQDNNEQLPPSQNEAAFKAAIRPYLAPSTLFNDPETGQPYLLNTTLSGVSLEFISAPADTWIIKDSTQNPNGSLNVGEVDGHVTPTLSFIPDTLAVGLDNVTHLVWAKADGTTAFTTLSTTGAVLGTAASPAVGGQIAGYGIAPDGTQRLLFNLGAGSETLEALDDAGDILNTSGNGPYDGWTPGPLAVTPSDETFMLWGRYNGKFVLRPLSPEGTPLGAFPFTFPAGWMAVDVAACPDETMCLLLTQPNPLAPLAGEASIVNTLASGQTNSKRIYANSGFTAVGLSIGPDNLVRLLWVALDGRAQLWTLAATGALQRSVPIPSSPGWMPIGVGVGPDGNARILSRDTSGDAQVRFVSPAGVTLATMDYAPPQ